MSDSGKETFGVLVTIESKTGATTVYGSYDLRSIINKGCEVLGYKCKFSDVEVPIKINRKSQFILGIDIEPKEAV